jgi:competence ComEA-like helix-hairpin-helix protein
MTAEERRALAIGVGLLVFVSLIRFGWESRPIPPVLPLDTSAYETLIPQVEDAVTEAARRAIPLAPGERLDPNRVDATELTRLPGVGPAMASRIVEAREARGWLVELDDLLEVPGIGPATFERIRPHLEITPPPPDLRLPLRALGEIGPTTERIPLNRASAAQLESLPGIGPALASRILEDRLQNGPYATLADLTRVAGVGPALVARLEGRVELP